MREDPRYIVGFLPPPPRIGATRFVFVALCASIVAAALGIAWADGGLPREQWGQQQGGWK